jgi:hypothetical protein
VEGRLGLGDGGRGDRRRRGAGIELFNRRSVDRGLREWTAEDVRAGKQTLTEEFDAVSEPDLEDISEPGKVAKVQEHLLLYRPCASRRFALSIPDSSRRW